MNNKNNNDDSDEITRSEFQFPPISSTQQILSNFRVVKCQQNNPRKKPRTKLMMGTDYPISSSSLSWKSEITNTKTKTKPKSNNNNNSKYGNGKKQEAEDRKKQEAEDSTYGEPKITRPCSECGKKFWSWKALFGHMRCHPERQWRGINPPPNLRRPVLLDNTTTTTIYDSHFEAARGGLSEDDHEVASCLLMLANGGGGSPPPPPPPPPPHFETPTTSPTTIIQGGLIVESNYSSSSIVRDGVALGGCGDHDAVGPLNNCVRFECSSCKKVFGSHQALGGHRASHKNVKGCFAITRSEFEDYLDDSSVGTGGRHLDDDRIGDKEKMSMMMALGGGGHQQHKCSICLRVFSSGQALGGHKRCHHWDEPISSSSSLPPTHTLAHGGLLISSPFAAAAAATSTREDNAAAACGLDLNLPPAPAPAHAPAQQETDSSSSCSSRLILDLRLGL